MTKYSLKRKLSYSHGNIPEPLLDLQSDSINNLRTLRGESIDKSNYQLTGCIFDKTRRFGADLTKKVKTKRMRVRLLLMWWKEEI
mmetsp:Transcript_29952/g.32628  ORF Transcript_29952/g.32628 Transcript_29952/m.32628 type:complete len:85 (+) Transcript_29952:3-257(+)